MYATEHRTAASRSLAERALQTEEERCLGELQKSHAAYKQQVDDNRQLKLLLGARSSEAQQASFAKGC